MGDYRKISDMLLYYKRKEIQKAIVESSQDREVGIRFGSKGYGKRPDVLVYENDVFSSIKKGATSFHVSEERWENPMDLKTSMTKKELEDLRVGWDLVLDIDCPFWDYSKLTASLFVKALRDHNVNSIGCKFSGNKGFHISVPFEAFPEKINEVDVKHWFPEGPKRIALYLLDYISINLIKIEKGIVDFSGLHKTTIDKISAISGKTKQELSFAKCSKCKSSIKNTGKKIEFICKKCTNRIFRDNKVNLEICPKCNIIMEKIEHDSLCRCGSNEFKEIFNPLSIIDVDTILISSRHMYRAPYSMHEKSGLSSMVISPDEIMSFEKEKAMPDNIKNIESFIIKNPKKSEAERLLVQAFDFKINIEANQGNFFQNQGKEYELPDIAIPEEYFPESIKKGLMGLEDGKKRFLFILINFLKSCGWTQKNIEELALIWNKKNPEPLKDNYILGQLRYSRQKKPVPPPNYSTGYYKDLGIPDPDSVMRKYKNPVVYVKAIYEQSTKKRRSKSNQKTKKLKNEDKKERI